MKPLSLTLAFVKEMFFTTELSPIVAINIASSVSDLGTKVAKKGSIGHAEETCRGQHLRKHAARDAKQLQKLVIPAHIVNVKQ